MKNAVSAGFTTPFDNFLAKKIQRIKTRSYSDHYIRNLERYGIICYKKLGDQSHYFAFASQIIKIPKLFARFDSHDRHFIESLAIKEGQDSWYCMAGHELTKIGFEKFVD